MNIRGKLKKYICLIVDRSVNDKFTIVDQDPIYELENDILEWFGLPTSFTISSSLQWVIINIHGETITVAGLKRYLQKQAIDYLLSDPLTDKELLEAGKKNKKPFDDVL